MKKQALFLVLMFSIAAKVYAFEVEYGGLWYDVISKTKEAKVIQYKDDKKYSGDIVIPETFKVNETTTYTVTSIGDEAFYNCYDLKSVKIPSSVTSIGEGAFHICNGLASVTIPNSVTSIGGEAFVNCFNLTSITFLGCVTSIGDCAFRNCSSLSSVHITDLLAWCMMSFSSPESNPLYHAHHLYLNESEIKNLVIPNSVTSIEDYSFYGCSGLSAVTIGSGVTNIGTFAFWECSGLTSVTISTSVTAIGQYAFYGCTGLTSITIPNSVTSIEQSTFENCNYLTSITIPQSVTSIGENAFAFCGLTSVTIPISVTSIGQYAFYTCRRLTSVDIPNSVTKIENSVFYDCTGLKSISIPNSVTSIELWAFSGCTSLSSVTIPNSVIGIGGGAFSRCDKLSTVTIGSGIKTIDNKAFSSCTGLTDMYCHAEGVPITKANAFEGSNIGNATLHVPDGLIDTYRDREPWNKFKTFVVLGGMPEKQKCATPTISFTKGKLHFDCETENVTFHYTITTPSYEEGKDNDFELSTKYKVTVYATKEDYIDSDEVITEVDAAGLKGDVNEDGKVTITDAVGVVDIILNEGEYCGSGVPVIHDR